MHQVQPWERRYDRSRTGHGTKRAFIACWGGLVKPSKGDWRPIGRELSQSGNACSVPKLCIVSRLSGDWHGALDAERYGNRKTCLCLVHQVYAQSSSARVENTDKRRHQSRRRRERSGFFPRDASVEDDCVQSPPRLSRNGSLRGRWPVANRRASVRGRQQHVPGGISGRKQIG